MRNTLVAATTRGTGTPGLLFCLRGRARVELATFSARGCLRSHSGARCWCTFAPVGNEAAPLPRSHATNPKQLVFEMVAVPWACECARVCRMRRLLAQTRGSHCLWRTMAHPRGRAETLVGVSRLRLDVSAFLFAFINGVARLGCDTNTPRARPSRIYGNIHLHGSHTHIHIQACVKMYMPVRVKQHHCSRLMHP